MPLEAPVRRFAHRNSVVRRPVVAEFHPASSLYLARFLTHAVSYPLELRVYGVQRRAFFPLQLEAL